MSRLIVIFFIFSIILFFSIGIDIPNVNAQAVPDWVKNNAGWWATDAISENEFVNISKDENNLEVKNKTISQIKNFTQEETYKPERKIEAENKKIEIKNFEELINICNKKKELKLKYELETNVRLVSFTDKRINISFNENLYKDFVKELSQKLYEWTNQRWIIAFSKETG